MNSTALMAIDMDSDYRKILWATLRMDDPASIRSAWSMSSTYLMHKEHLRVMVF